MPPITPERWEQITDLFANAVELAPDARMAFVARLHATDSQAANELASLLEYHERPGQFLPVLPALAEDEVERLPRSADARGRTVGAYRIARLLGSGGMGTVYLAERNDGLFDKQVAVKLLSPVFAHAHDRVHRERELLARLDHPNITRLIDAGATAEGWPYLVMDYIDGVPIDRYCADRGLSIEERLGVLAQVCAGIAHAHQRLVIHCDIKPENILVTADGTVKLLDFGIAKLLEGRATMTVFRPGTPTYASPEQLRGDPITTASDVYSIGVLAYVILTGSWPYPARAKGVADATHIVLTMEPVNASRVPGLAPTQARKLRGDVENVLARAVAKDSARRYQSVEQLADDLDALRRGFPVRARANTTVYRLATFVRRHRVGTAISLAALALLLVLAGFGVRQARLAERESANLRAFAHSVVFDANESLATVSGTTETRKRLVEMALRSLDRLSADRTTDVSLREELASAYIRVGRIQGGAFLPNLGDTRGAIASFRKAVATIASVPASPALARLGMEAHLNIAQLATDPADGAPEFDRAITDGERQLSGNPGDRQTLRLVARAYHGKATIAHLTNNVPDHVRFVRRAIALREQVRSQAPGSWQDEIDLAREYAQLAIASMQEGNASAALQELERGRTLLEAALRRLPSNQLIVRGLAEIHSRSVTVLMALDRDADAVAAGERAVALLQPLVQSDTRNTEYLGDLATAWFWLADARRAQGNLTDALQLSQRSLAVRRRRAAQDSSLMFVPAGLATNLNAVGALLMQSSPKNWREARPLFAEARDVAQGMLARAPGYNEVRKSLAVSYEGLAHTVEAELGENAPAVRAVLEKSRDTWAEVSARSVGDRRHVPREEAVKQLIADRWP
jgi:non-specific serine/threonine protein kinase/serine/threonine-protein kinase